MARIGLVGASYQSLSANADCQRCRNWYVENIESQQGKGSMALYPTAGLKVFAALGGKSLRGQYFINGREWAVADSNLYEVFKDGTKTLRNADLPLANDGLPVSFASTNPTTGNPGQLVLASGGSVYVLNVPTNKLSIVTPDTFNNGFVSQIVYCDGFFIAFLRDSNLWFVSSPLDGTVWPNFSGISVFPENIKGALVDHREVWIWGETHFVVYYFSGGIFFPLDVLGGGFGQQGLAATFAASRADNGIFWIGSDENGSCMAWRAQGYSPVRCSTHAIETAWQKMQKSSRIDDAVAYSFQENGHVFWQITFPSGDQTWVYDTATGFWHERSFLDASTAPPVEHAHRSWNHQNAFGKHLVGDPLTGTLYEMSSDFLDDFGHPIKRLRRAPHLSTEQERIFYSSLQIDIEVGGGPAFQGNAPATYFNLQAANGIVWQIGMNDQGDITSTNIGAGIASPKVMNDVTGTYSFQFVVSLIGVVQLVPTVFGSGNASTFDLVSTTGQTRSTLTITAISPVLGQINTMPPVPVTRGPLLMLRYSNDSARTFFEREPKDCGLPGEYLKRVIWRRMGSARDRVYEISTTDAWAPRIIDAYLKASPGFTSQERLVSEARKRA